MGDGTEKNPYTREDVIKLIEEHGGSEGLDLSGIEFKKGINLSGLDLSRIILNGARFQDEYKIIGPQILTNPAQLQKVNLQGAQLQRAELALAQLQGANLALAQLQKAHLLSANLQGAFMRMAQLQGADLVYAQLQGADLYGAKLQGAFLNGIKLSPDTRLENADWGNYILGEENRGSFSLAVATYRQLKIWHTEQGLYDIAGEFFFREMTSKRKELKWWPNPFPRIWSKFLSILCGYGERPLRVIGWAASVVSGLTFIYFIIGSVWEWWAFWKSLYFSAVSFTALGYGSWLEITNDWIKGIGAFESFIGVFMIALFLVTFTRKMIR